MATSSLHGQWAQEIETWRPDLEYELSTYQGTARRKGRQLMKSKVKPDLDHEWGTIIYDEAVRLKNHKSNLNRVAQRLAKRTDRLILLSGTPLPNWSHELFGLLRILEPEGVDVGSYWRWVGEWFSSYDLHFGERKVRQIGPLHQWWSWDEFVTKNRLDEHYLGRTKEDHLDLPPLTVIDHPIQLRGAQRKLYDELKRDYVAWVEATGEEVSAWSSGGLHTKLRQAATGLPIVTESDGPAAKIELAVELAVDQLPAIMFCHYRRSAEYTAAACEKAGMSADIIMGGMKAAAVDKIRNRFQDGELDVLVGTIDTMSEGLTLHRANTAFMIEISYRPDLNQQAMDRLHRVGQTRPVTINRLIATNTVDESVVRLLEEKQGQTVPTIDAMRRLSARRFAELL